MSKTYEYTLKVEGSDEEGYMAYLDNLPTPLSGFSAESPLQAIRMLCEVLVEWKEGGSLRWLNSLPGTKLARQFVPDFEPGNEGGKA